MTPLDFATTLHRRPDRRVKVIDFCRRYKRSLPDARARSVWPRWRVVQELQEEYDIGRDADGVTFVGGLSFEPSRQWTAIDGRLVLV